MFKSSVSAAAPLGLHVFVVLHLLTTVTHAEVRRVADLGPSGASQRDNASAELTSAQAERLAAAVATKVPERSAAAHFELGVSLANAGDYDGAIAEFRAAYDLKPHPAVLMNLGEAEAAAGHAAAAVDAMKGYLTKYGAMSPPESVARARHILATNEKRLALVRLRLPLGIAAVALDGHDLPATEWSNPLRVAAGQHALTVRHEDGTVSATNFRIKPGETLEIPIDPVTRATAVAPGILELTCSVPATEVFVAGKPMALGEPLLLEAKTYRVEFKRVGYKTSLQTIAVQSARTAELECGLLALPELDLKISGALRVLPSEDEADVFVNGAPFSAARLPLGPHRIDVVKPGFKPWSTNIKISPGQNKVLKPLLLPTRHTLAEAEERASRLRTWSYVAGAGAVAFGATAGVLALISAGKHKDWLADGKDYQQNGGRDANLDAERERQLYNGAIEIERLDAFTTGAAVGAGLLLSTGVLLTFEALRVEGKYPASVRDIGQRRTTTLLSWF